MSKIISSIFWLLLLAVPLMTRAESKTVISSCDGEVAKSSTIGVNSADSNIEAATLFPSAMLSDFEDLQALGVNVGLTSRLNVSEIKVWIRESLNGKNIFEASLLKNDGIKTGWNQVSGSATPLPKGKDLYVGYTLIVSGASYPVSAVGECRPDGLWVNTTGKWEDMSDLGYGALSVELVATASNLIPYDLVLRQVSIPESVKIGSTVPLGLKIFNAGAESVSGFKIECDIDGCSPVVYDVEQTILPNEYADLTLDFTSPLQQKAQGVTMTVRIGALKEGEDANQSNNAKDVVFAVNRFDFVKKLLMEEFTTERCTYCPRAAATLHDLLAEPQFEGNIMAVAHHAGFGVDWLTVPASNSYLWFYNGGAEGTYAPAFMYDRNSFDNGSPVSNGTDEYSSIKQRVAERLAVIPMTALEATGDYDPETSYLNIKVEGERLERYDGDRITIYVVENNIPARNQSGATGEFIHQHVLRELNEIWGAEINWDADNYFSYETSIYMNPSWKLDNVEVYAMISRYDATNYKNCTIDNATEATIDWHLAGVEEVESETYTGQPEYYTLTGQRVTNPTSGIYIVKRGERVSKEMIH